MSTREGSDVLLAIKTPMMPRASTAFVRGNMTVGDSIAEVCRRPSSDANGKRVVQQIAREMTGTHSLLAISKAGEVRTVDPHTLLTEIAFPREIRTKEGIEEVPSVAVEIQKYTPVGKGD